MNSSGIKRGLATTAVSALAIAGLPLFASSAQAAHGTAEVTLISQGAAGNDASVKNDGQDTTVRLEAEVADPTNAVVFQYNPNPTAAENDANWVTIATVTANDEGYASFEWNPAGLVGGEVALRAQVTETVGGTTTVYNSARSNVAILGGGAAANSVNITAGTTKGVFQEPYSDNDPAVNDASDAFTNGTNRWSVVEGTTSATSGTVGLYWYRDSDDSKQGATTANVTQPQGSQTGVFRGIVNIDGYDFSGNPDQIAFGAERDTDDIEAFELYNQTIDSVTAAPTSATVPGSGTAQITVTVLDQNDAPIAGAEVRSSNGTLVGYTNAQGRVTATQAGGSTTFYYANATDSNPFEAGLGDQRSADVTVGQYNPQATELEATSDNGSAFAYNEYDSDDITVQVLDQQGEDFSTSQNVQYYWTFAAFDGTQTTPRIPASGTTSIAAVNGEADIPLPVQGEGGTYTLFAGLAADPTSGQGAVPVSQVLTVQAGTAEIVFAEASEEAPAGESEEIVGSLELVGSNVGLPNRSVLLSYAGGDARFDQETGPDQATRLVTTGANGGFSATLDDPTATPQTTETGIVTAATQAKAEADDPADLDNPNATATNPVTFFNATAPDGATVEISTIGTGTPGTEENGTVTVEDENGNPLSGVAVTLTVDGESFFTSGDPDPAPANGADQGELEDLGQEITVITGVTGTADFSVAIERSEEFDDDGLAEDVVTATISTDSDTEDVDWDTSNPLNGGEVIIELAAARFQDSGVLPQAPTTDEVAYDVMVTDQFGNPVGGVDVEIDANNGGDVTGTENANDFIETDFADNAEFYLESDIEADVTPTGTWDAPVNEYGAGGAVAAPTSEDIEGDGPTAEFYLVDFGASTFTLAQQGEETVPVGTTVIMDYTAIDQNGEPIEFSVDFFRTGPDDFQDGDPNNPNPVPTGEDGMATYVFSGAAEGTATVTAIGYENGSVVPESQATDTVAFGPGGGGGEKVEVEALISGDSNGGKKDVVRFQVDDAAEGATVNLFKIRGTKSKGNRRLVEVREDIVPEGGTLTFKVADRNGNKKTRFVAKVAEGDNNLEATSNTQKLR